MELEQEIKQVSEKIRREFGESDAKRDANLRVPQKLITIYDIPYGNDNLLDVYYPEETKEKLPVIVNVHGGGYTYGSKEVYQFYGMSLALEGFVFVNVNYRLAPEYLFPTQLGDIVQALHWVEEQAENYYMDCENVFLVGDSAGAQMASQLGAIYSNRVYASLFPFQLPERVKIRAMALNCGLYDLLRASKEKREEKNEEGMSNFRLMELYLGRKGRRMEEMLRVCENINGNYPPSFIMTSYYDFLRSQAKPFYELLCERGVKAEYHLYGEKAQQYMGHVFHCNMNLEEAKQCNTEECEFFKQHIA